MGAGFHNFPQGPPTPEIPRGANTQDVILDLCRQVEALTRRVTYLEEGSMVVTAGLDGRPVLTNKKALEAERPGGFIFADDETRQEVVRRLAEEKRKRHANEP